MSTPDLLDLIANLAFIAFAVYLGAVLACGAVAVLATGAKKLLWRWPWGHRLAGRIQIAALSMLKALDILGCTIWLAPLYVIGLADKPTGRQMISSYVGKAAFNGHYWAIALEHIIDFGAEALGDKPGHCLRAYLHYRGKDQ